MKPRLPQLALRLDAATSNADAPWCAGAAITYLGSSLRLVLDTACSTPARIGEELHLPLPPAATPRQIRDAAESWLRDEAMRHFTAVVAEKSALAGRQAMAAPRVALSFGKHGDWVKSEIGLLRCHWRLIEQPADIIAQVLQQALPGTHAAPACEDLFSFA
jgi:hypothetical protein